MSAVCLTEGGGAGSVLGVYSRLYGLPSEQIKGAELREDWFRGKMTADDFFARLNALHADCPPANKELFLRYSASVFVRSESVRILAAELRRVGLKTGIISDAVEFVSREHMRRGDYDGFDPVLLSWREGMTKSDVRLFERALDVLQLPADKVLFLDDKKACLESAQKLGIYTILAKSPAQIVRDIKALIELENGVKL